MSNSLNKQTKGIFTFIAINDRVTLIIRLSNSGNQFSNRTASPSDSTCFTVSAYFLLHARVFFFFFCFFLEDITTSSRLHLTFQYQWPEVSFTSLPQQYRNLQRILFLLSWSTTPQL